MSLFLTILASVFALEVVCWWGSDRLIRSLGARPWARGFWSLFMASQVLCLLWLVLGRTFVFYPEGLLPQFVLSATFIWHLLVLPAVLVGLIGFGVRWGVGAVARGMRPATPDDTAPGASTLPENEMTDQAVAPTRRQFLGAAVAVTPPVVTALATGVAASQLDHFRVREMTLALPRLPPDLDGMTIAHVSDIHVGRFTRGKVLGQVVEATNRLRADLVLLTGDLINMDLADLPAALDVIKRMDARSGVYMCEGNHDLIQDRREFERRTKASGVPLMVNESLVVPVRGRPVQLLGLRWGSGGGRAGPGPGGSRASERGDEAIAASMRSLLPQLKRDEDVFPILLAHHPHAFDPAAAAGIPLTLAGHTHGGQLMLSRGVGFGPWMYRYWSGDYRRNDCTLVVSNGVGNWFPLRVGAPAEIIHLTLRKQG